MIRGLSRIFFCHVLGYVLVLDMLKWSQLGMKCFASQQDYVDWKSVTLDVLIISFLGCVFFLA